MILDVAEFVDRQRFGSFQIRIMVLCGLVQFLDGFDSLMLAYTAPALSHAWNFPRSALGPVFAASLSGIAIGTVVLSPMADWIGRKNLLIISVLIFGGLTLATSQAQTLGELRVLRFFTGFGLAAAVPSTVVLVNEFAPRRHRGAMVMGMSIGVAVGAACGGQLTALLLPSFGWQGVFYVGGVAPLLLAPALYYWLPESVRFLMVKGNRRREIVGILNQLDPEAKVPGHVQLMLHHRAQPKGFSVGELFARGRIAITALLWLSFFLSLIVLNFLNNWLPSVLHGTGLPMAQALRIGTLFQLGGIVGIVSMGFLADRFGYFKVLICTFLLEAAVIAAIGWGSGSVPLLIVAVPVVGMCVLGANNALMALGATLYPTAVRATGTSWAHGFGRFGGIAGPIIGGILLELHWSFQEVFSVGAIFPLCGVVVMIAMAVARVRGLRNEPQEAAPARQLG
jgi:AAHS family 4-hydroxybenzoate transporter-like MFS transporter